MINLNKTVYIVLHLFLVFSFLFAFMIYTSLNINFPWYDSYGMQFLNLFTICVPLLLIIGICFVLLNTRYSILKGDLFLPFYSIIGIVVPVLLDDKLSSATLLTGMLCSLAAMMLTMLFLINQFSKCLLTKKLTKTQILTMIFLAGYVIWEVNVDNWSETMFGPRIRVDLIFIYPILLVLVSISVYQIIKLKRHAK